MLASQDIAYLTRINGECVHGTQIMDNDNVPLAYNVIKGHNSRTIKVMLPKFVLDLSFVQKSIVITFHKI